MQKITHETRDDERAYYGLKNAECSYIVTKGEKDGESAFKETNHIVANHCQLFLRYPFWHSRNSSLLHSHLYTSARAPFWYDDNFNFEHVICYGVKAVREGNNITVNNSTFHSIEFGWKTNHFYVNNSKIIGYYPFFGCNDVHLNNVNLKGKYSFQYINDLIIENSYLDTKDAFWHCKNVLIKNSTVIGEYLAWYAEDITFINCKIIGTQPLCYTKNVTLKDCTFEKADLAFENSSVSGNIIGTIDSIKNPLSGRLVIDSKPIIIIDEFSRDNGDFELIIKQ